MARAEAVAVLVVALLCGAGSGGARAGATIEVAGGGMRFRIVTAAAAPARWIEVPPPPGLPVGADDGAPRTVGRAEVPLPAGRVARAYAEPPPEVLAWPRSAPLRAGCTVRFHAEPLRTVALAVPRGGVVLRFVPDRTEVPAGPAERTDALQAWIDLETPRSVANADGSAHVRLPATAWWVFGRSGRTPLRARIGPDDPAADVRPPPLRRLGREPTVGGRTLPRGALVAPGRLDLAAAAALRTLAEIGDVAGAVVRGAGPWEPADLPADDVLTLWHPDFGLAFAPWGPAGAGDGVPEPGALAFLPEGGGRFTGTVAVWPAWPGTGEVFSRPSDRGLRLTVDGARRLVFRGLPPGRYRFDHAVAPAGAPPGGALRHGEADVRAERPRVVVRLPGGT